MNNRHENFKPCPITGKPIPNEFIWTDHSKENCFNSCKACNKSEFNSVGEALAALNNSRQTN